VIPLSASLFIKNSGRFSPAAFPCPSLEALRFFFCFVSFLLSFCAKETTFLTFSPTAPLPVAFLADFLAGVGPLTGGGSLLAGCGSLMSSSCDTFSAPSSSSSSASSSASSCSFISPSPCSKSASLLSAESSSSLRSPTVPPSRSP